MIKRLIIRNLTDNANIPKFHIMQEKFFTLLQLNKSIRNLVASVNREFWIVAEIAHIQIQEHAYLELVQKENERIVAKARGIVWSNILQQSLTELGETLFLLLRVGSNIRCRVAVNFHEVHGLALHINAIDAFYALGQMEQQRLQTLAKLEQSGLLYMQQKLSLPLVLQKIAVVSSQMAAGFGDFINQLNNNPWRYRFSVTLFPTGVQGENAIPSLVEQIGKIDKRFDVLAVIRGGGARLDLEIFNAEVVATAIARCPIPALTGIGHQRDTTVADRTAYLSLKTPTAVAEFILQHNLQFESKIFDLTRKIALYSSEKINEQNALFHDFRLGLIRKTHEKISGERMRQQRLHIGVETFAKEKLQNAQHRIEAFEQFFRVSNPKYLLAKGYFLIRRQGKYLKGADLRSDMQVEIEGHQSVFEARIGKKVE